MSLLSICQNVSDDTPMSRPTVIVGSSNSTARLLFAAARRAGDSLYRAFDWLELEKEHTFTTVASTVDYSLPSDYGRMINSTLWDRTNFEVTRGPLTPQAWQVRRSSVLANTATNFKHFRIRNVSGAKNFSIHPTPDAADDLVFEYISDQWCQSSGGTGQTTWQADTDTGILDEYLIELGTRWRVLNRLGLEYEEEFNEYILELEKAKAYNKPLPDLSLTNRRDVVFVGPDNVPDTGFGS